MLEVSLWHGAGKPHSRFSSHGKSARPSWHGNVQRPSVQGTPDAVVLFYSWLMAYRSPISLPQWGSTGALCISGSNVFSIMAWQGWQTNLAAARAGSRTLTLPSLTKGYTTTHICVLPLNQLFLKHFLTFPLTLWKTLMRIIVTIDIYRSCT